MADYLKTPAEKLERHIIRAMPHATVFRQTIQRLMPEYRPPWREGIGWDTMFMPVKPNQAYVPIPIVYFTVNVLSAVMGMRPPVFQAEPLTSSVEDRNKAADKELMIKYEQERQNWAELHLDITKTLCLKGRAAVKVGYGPKDDLWTEEIPNVENLIADFTDDSYRRVRTWSYHQMLSPDEARDSYGWKGEQPTGVWQVFTTNWQSFDHANALGRGNVSSNQPPFIGVPLTDFHYKDDAGRVRNATFIGHQLIDDVDTKLPDFPYIAVNCDVEPGNPFGIGDAEPVVAIQKEIATRLTAWAEAIRRNGQDQWVTYNLRGLTPKDLPGGGRYFPLGDKETEGIEPLKFPIDNLGFHEYILEMWENYRKVTGIPPDILGGGNIPHATSGYAMALRYQSVITKLSPREVRLKSFYQRLAMITAKNMEVVDPKTKSIFNDNYYFKVDFEQVTPRDFAETVSSLSAAVQAGILSRRTAMEELNKVSEDEMTYIREWNSDKELSPQTAAAIQTIEGQMQSIQNGNPAAMQQQADVTSAAAKPDLSGQNQHTAPVPIAMRQRAAQLAGPAAPASGVPGTNPPGL